MSLVKELLKGSAAATVGACILGPLGSVAAVWATHKMFPPATDVTEDPEWTCTLEEFVELLNQTQTELTTPQRRELMSLGYKLQISEGRFTWVLK